MPSWKHVLWIFGIALVAIWVANRVGAVRRIVGGASTATPTA
jgi:hypothetical protein